MWSANLNGSLELSRDVAPLNDIYHADELQVQPLVVE
jgi:hypothetical protein